MSKRQRQRPRTEDVLATGLVRFAAVLLCLVILLSCVNILVRQFTRPLIGAFEVIEFIIPVISLCYIPWCELQRGHIRVTPPWLPRPLERLLDRIIPFVMVSVFGLLTWRMAAGAIDKAGNNQATALLQLPLWWQYGLAAATAAVGTVAMLLAAFRKPDKPQS